MLKFRAWHKAYKRMIPVYELFWVFELFGGIKSIILGDNKDQLYAIREIELMQFTGYQDNTKTDIFEGDILCYYHGGGVETYLIERDDSNTLIANFLYLSGYDVDDLRDTPLESSVIVGNQWANPELLEDHE